MDIERGLAQVSPFFKIKYKNKPKFKNCVEGFLINFN